MPMLSTSTVSAYCWELAACKRAHYSQRFSGFALIARKDACVPSDAYVPSETCVPSDSIRVSADGGQSEAGVRPDAFDQSYSI